MFLAAIAAELTLWDRYRISGDEFHCGNCRRAETCGLPPSDECEERLVQSALAGEGRRSTRGRNAPDEVRR